MKSLLSVILSVSISLTAFAQAPQQQPPLPPPGAEGLPPLGEEQRVKKTGKEFTTSVIYGVMAGTLVGAATLAFTSNPGGNLNNVARGASYGLYAGILLGAYATYDEDEGPRPSNQSPSIYESPLPGEELPPNQGLPPDGQEQPQGNSIKSMKVFAGVLPVDQNQIGPAGFVQFQF